MMLDNIFKNLSKLAVLSVIFTLTISCAGFFYLRHFSHVLGYDVSPFDMDFYTFLDIVLKSDSHNLIVNFSHSYLLIFVFCVLYPKSLQFVFDILIIFFLIGWNYLGWNFFKFLYSFKNFRYFFWFFAIYTSPLLILISISLLIPLFFIAVILFGIYLIIGLFIRNNVDFDKYMQKGRTNVEENFTYKKISEHMDKLGNNIWKMDFVLACIVYFSAMFLILGWLHWAGSIEMRGSLDAKNYLNSTNYKKVYLIDKTVFDAVFVSKVKNGYLFVLKDGEKNKEKASFIPDSAILRID
ncbi:hypothetical protein [Acinetobacter courvalinii]|uniref:Uncharacterized protein n=1 Tax=Acinetobacter courvalinii TaxID=280147 RepID=A0AA42LFN1_9GAMM|nr:hypothetical protein [Acinetobacter courvalinii]MDH0564832.1 hypothetical protein [Acinetobacter courvalinii]